MIEINLISINVKFISIKVLNLINIFVYTLPHVYADGLLKFHIHFIVNELRLEITQQTFEITVLAEHFIYI